MAQHSEVIREQFDIHLSVSTIQQIVATRVYTGEVRRGDQVVNSHAHPPIIAEADWQRAQHQKGARHTRNGRIAAQGILTGLVLCAGCGQPVSTNTGRTAAYGCKNRRKAECTAPAAVAVHLLDAHVLPGILKRMGAGFDVQAYVNDRERARLAIIAAEDELDAFLQHASAARSASSMPGRRRNGARLSGWQWQRGMKCSSLDTRPGRWTLTPNSGSYCRSSISATRPRPSYRTSLSPSPAGARGVGCPWTRAWTSPGARSTSDCAPAPAVLMRPTWLPGTGTCPSGTDSGTGSAPYARQCPGTCR